MVVTQVPIDVKILARQAEHYTAICIVKCKLTAVGIEYNYVLVIAQNIDIKKKKKKKSFRLSSQGFGPNHCQS